MNKLGLAILVMCGISAVSAPAFAYDNEYRDNRDNQDNREERGNYSQARWGGIESDVNHLNRMVGQVRWQLTRYRPDWGIRRDFARIRHDVDRVNGQFRQRNYDRRRLRGEIQRIHAELHQLEERMHVRSSDYYRWGR
jgi:hypothetical protein